MNEAVTARIEALREQVGVMIREARAISETVGMLDLDTLDAEEKESVWEVIDSMGDIQRALFPVEELVDGAIHHARRLP